MNFTQRYELPFAQHLVAFRASSDAVGARMSSGGTMKCSVDLQVTGNTTPIFTLLLLLFGAPAMAQETVGGVAATNATANLGVTVTEIYDDNIFAIRNNKEDDFITVISPFLTLDSAGARHDVVLDLGGDLGIYNENDSENYLDYWAGLEAEFDKGGAVDYFGGARYSRLHEERNSPEDVLGVVPTEFDDMEGFLGMRLRLGNVTARLGGTYERLDYIDDRPTFDVANHDDRDRDLLSLGARLGYRPSPALELFVQGASDSRQYDEPFDDFLLDRDSDGYNAAVGLQFRSGPRLAGEVLAGYMHQDYDDPSLTDVSALDVGALVQWRASGATTVRGALDRTLEETTLLGASSYMRTALSAQVAHQLRPDLNLSADAIFARREFEGVNRADDITEIGTGAAWFFQPRLFVGLDYRMIDQNSNLSTNDYTENRILLSLGARLNPAYSEKALAAAMAAADGRDEAAPDGFYIGLQGSHNDLMTELVGPRGSGGTVENDSGDQGFGGGVFAGYGADFGRWYLGGELSADMTAVKYGHANVPIGRVWSVERGPSYAVEGRLGRTLEDGSLIYGRAGVVASEFQTDYVRTMQSLAVRSASQDDMQTGMRMGAGAEFPLTGNLFGRMEYVYTAYADYDVMLDAPSADIDNFANEEGAFRLGLGYRFGAAAEQRNKATQHDFGGPYTAIQVGFGGLYTDNSGPRENNSFLSVERADHGAVGGVLAGAGTTIGALYLGGEIDAELSDMNWNVARSNDRVYSVERKESYGAGARLGVVVNDATLIYGRAGAVRTRFTTDYLKQDTGDHVIQDDRLTGVRFGGGVEMPASERGFVRLDYSYIDYGDGYSVDYVSGVDDFDHSEAVLRLIFGIQY